MTEHLTPPRPDTRSYAHHPGTLAVLIALLLTPLAWLLQMLIAETLAAQSCYPFNHPLSAPIVPWLRPTLVVISLLCLAAGIFGAMTAWRNLCRIGPMAWGAMTGARRTRAELDWFGSRVAMMCSALFLFALVATDVALTIVSPCRGW